MKKVEFYKCKKCGNMILLLQSSNKPLSCCNENMSLITPNYGENEETHKPVSKSVLKQCKNINQSIDEIWCGKETHPMTYEHHILWIGTFDQESWVIKWLKPNQIPKKNLKIHKWAEVYAYCTKHGLWKKD